jgi:alkylated DNA repair dioxygenase AlkB
MWDDRRMPSSVELDIDRRRPVERIALGDGRSWVELTTGFIRRPDDLLEQVIATTPWTQGSTWRFDHYVDEHRLGAWIPAGSMPPAVRHSGLHLESRYRVRFSGVSTILYRDGNDFQGLHSDREMKWLDDTLIAIVVLGDSRPFQLRPRRNANDPAQRRDASDDVVLRPGHGDLLVMGGRCQQDWLHGVPPDRTTDPRLSITWRWSSRRGRPDTAPSYSDGRHYSDGPRVNGHRTRPAHRPADR